MKSITEPSKDELLGLIYHNMPHTLYVDHPCECAVCGSHNCDELVEIYNRWVKFYYYECDRCAELE